MGKNDSNEIDPTGRGAHDLGAKLDYGKLRYDLVLDSMSNAIRAVVEVAEFGAKKYAENSWLEVPEGEKRYTRALLRHYFSEINGSDNDRDSGLLHAAHLAWNALSRLELKLRENKK